MRYPYRRILKVVTCLYNGRCFFDQFAQLQLRNAGKALLFPRPARLQHLLDSTEQPLTIREHDAVKFLLLCSIKFTIFQGLEVELYRGDRRLELVSDRV